MIIITPATYPYIRWIQFDRELVGHLTLLGIRRRHLSERYLELVVGLYYNFIPLAVLPADDDVRRRFKLWEKLEYFLLEEGQGLRPVKGKPAHLFHLPEFS
jgi:hypothetical protein